jgi:ABC-type uncharacterized transport system auxiliary subunit
MKRPITWFLVVIALLLLLYLLGCALTTTQTLDIFSRDHTRHQTNAVPQKP